MKEKIWIEKLIELLNEYEKKGRKSEYYEWGKWIWWPNNLFRRDTRDEEWSHLYSDTADTYVISKKYGFIKWLVENDKIDREQFYDKARKIITDFDLRWEYEWACNEIIMLLSISDTPIEDLISYLK